MTAMFSSSSPTFPSVILFRASKNKHCNSFPRGKPLNSFICLSIGLQEIAEIAQNKVIVSATVASAVGQLAKPFTSALYGRGINLRAAVTSGGMPSTHSAGVVAAATAIGLERGFSDSVFGLSVVFAAIVMYDAQGVRKEVGYHAKILNRILKTQKNPSHCWEENGDLVDSDASIKSKSFAPLLSLAEKASSYNGEAVRPSSKFPLSCGPENRASSARMTPSSFAVDGEEESKVRASYFPLKESVGHTEIEVAAGALLGFLVTFMLAEIL